MGLLLLDTLLLHVAVLCTCSKVLYISVLLITKFPIRRCLQLTGSLTFMQRLWPVTFFIQFIGLANQLAVQWLEKINLLA